MVGTVAAITDVPEFAPAIAGMMAIGVGIDYALLVITRYRTALGDGLRPEDEQQRRSPPPAARCSSRG
ncbi:MAG TPA: MMPL family transporter [Solirubrobacteraceae bacterium]|nr:MMPL family transporter [Solirubrobacteraceae bacterium]